MIAKVNGSIMRPLHQGPRKASYASGLTPIDDPLDACILSEHNITFEVRIIHVAK